MSSKLFSRSGVFAWSPRGVEHKGLVVANFAQFFDPNATSLEQKIDFLSSAGIFQQPNLAPTVSVDSNYRFNELAWTSMCSDAHPNGIVAGGTEDGSVVFLDAYKLINESHLEVISARKDHHGHVLTIDVSRDGRWMASGGGSGQILLWDCANLKTPFSPGAPNFQDQVKLLRWNQKNEAVFASISSRRVSCWDMRRNGAPVLEFAEVPSCDWSSLCWNPSDASQLIVASQSQHVSVVQKWDSRFTSTPIKEYRHHQVGVTSVDWNKADDRLLISSGCDGQVIIWNHETSEVLGGVGSLQGDWIRSVKWNEVEPVQFAIQYFQHPLQISSLTTLGAPQPGTDVLAARLSDDFVPAWHRAPLIGSSISLGARLATFWKSYDAQSQQWQHNVEVETINADFDVGAAEIAQYLHVKDDRRNLGWYLHERAHAEPADKSPELAELENKVWLVLLGLYEGAGRNKLLHYLELMEDEEDLTTATTTSLTATTTAATTTSAMTEPTTTQSARSASIISTADTEEGNPEQSILEKCAKIEWSRVNQSGWDMVMNTIRQEHLTVIQVLLSQKQHVAALAYSARNDPDHIRMILNDYIRNQEVVNPLTSIALAFSPTSRGTTESADPVPALLRKFPDEKWRELLGTVVAHVLYLPDFRRACRSLGCEWLKAGHPLRACLAFIIGGDVDGLLRANTSFSPADRLKQALILFTSSPEGSKFYPPGLDKFICHFARRLLSQGAGAVAWNLLKAAKSESPDLQELRWTCFQVAGGRDCTGDQPPFNPYDTAVKQPASQRQFQQQPQIQRGPAMMQQPPQMPPQNGFGTFSPSHSQAPPIPDYQRNPNLAPMPPSSTFYQTPSWDHKPPPQMPPNMPPPRPAAPVTPGWNDPPPMAFKTKEQQEPVKRNVMQVNWKPLEVAGTPMGNAMMAGFEQMNHSMQGMTLQNGLFNGSPASSTFPSPSPQQAVPPTPAPPPIQLSAEDEKIMTPITQLAGNIIETARIQARIEKATELRARIQAELVPRLAANRLSPQTKGHLNHMAYFIEMHQLREAQACVAQMARNASDFVEISSFLPALKSLLSLATH